MDETVVVDTDALSRLEEWGGRELVLKMLAIFFEHAPERIEQIRSGARDGQLEETERGAHSLKSSAGNLGARRLQARAAEMEEKAADGELDEVTALLPDLESAWAEALAALTDVRNSLSE